MSISQTILKILEKAQKNEITEYHIYKKLARRTKDENNKKVLDKISEEEKNHYEIWKKYTGKEVSPNWLSVFFYYFISRIFGLTFGVKLMEKGEELAHKNYLRLIEELPEAEKIAKDEEAHENKLIAMIQEGRLNYIGSIVLGLNDALVELTGALAGLTFAFQNTRLIAAAGLITGIAASFSMAASEYLSNKAEGNSETSLSSALYTGIAYIFTVIALIFPYLVLSNLYLCLGLTLGIAIIIILFFNFYIAVAKDLNFARRFWEMALLSLGVAGLSFGIGIFIRSYFGIEL